MSVETPYKCPIGGPAELSRKQVALIRLVAHGHFDKTLAEGMDPKAACRTVGFQTKAIRRLLESPIFRDALAAAQAEAEAVRRAQEAAAAPPPPPPPAPEPVPAVPVAEPATAPPIAPAAEPAPAPAQRVETMLPAQDRWPAPAGYASTSAPLREISAPPAPLPSVDRIVERFTEPRRLTLEEATRNLAAAEMQRPSPIATPIAPPRSLRRV